MKKYITPIIMIVLLFCITLIFFACNPLESKMSIGQTEKMFSAFKEHIQNEPMPEQYSYYKLSFNNSFVSEDIYAVKTKDTELITKIQDETLPYSMSIFLNGEYENIIVDCVNEVWLDPVITNEKRDWDEFGYDKFFAENWELIKHIVLEKEEYISRVSSAESYIPYEGVKDSSLNYDITIECDVEKLKEAGLVSNECREFTIKAITNKDANKYDSIGIIYATYDKEKKEPMENVNIYYGEDVAKYEKGLALTGYETTKNYYLYFEDRYA